MADFASLLNQFKQNTSSSSSGSSKKRPHPSSNIHSSFQTTSTRSTSQSTHNNNNTGRDDHSQSNKKNTPSTYNYPSTTPVRRIYIACPAFTETGGPEALHQLCHVINTGGYYHPYATTTTTNNHHHVGNEEKDAIVVGNDDDATTTASLLPCSEEGDTSKKAAANNTANTANTATTTNGKQHQERIQAYMLYLRERTATNTNSYSGSGKKEAVEHVRSQRARPSKYDRYDAPPAETLPGADDDDRCSDSTQIQTNEEGYYSNELVIWPECWTHLIDSLEQRQSPNNDNHPHSSSRGPNNTTSAAKQSSTKRYQIAIWWLSVDNNKGRFLAQQFVSRKDVLHLCQSAYAREYVTSKIGGLHRVVAAKDGGGNVVDTNGKGCDHGHVLDLTEFIPHASASFHPSLATALASTTTTDTSTSNNASGRDLDVVYNPIKGIHYTDEIIRRACGKKSKTNVGGGSTSNRSSVVGSGIQFSPIGKGVDGRERMTGEEVVDLLKRAKVYIDFGPHPGMDRLPREAALAGCIVLTNREGAANFDTDVPLPSEFKFQEFDADRIHSTLKDCCCTNNNNSGSSTDGTISKYQEYRAKMEAYKKWILGQEDQMKACVDKLVEEVVRNRIHNNSNKP